MTTLSMLFHPCLTKYLPWTQHRYLEHQKLILMVVKAFPFNLLLNCKVFDNDRVIHRWEMCRRARCKELHDCKLLVWLITMVRLKMRRVFVSILPSITIITAPSLDSACPELNSCLFHYLRFNRFRGFSNKFNIKGLKNASINISCIQSNILIPEQTLFNFVAKKAISSVM